MRATRNANLVFGIVLLAVMCFCAGDIHAKENTRRRTKGKGISARGAYAVDLATGRVLFSKNGSVKFYPASTVKLLTALVVLEHVPLDKGVFVSKRAWAVQPTKAGLRPGVSYAARDLLRVLLASSANDAGVALAEAVSGSEPDFAVLMNRKAKALGARHSYFTNATGLPDSRQVITARDLCLITRAAFGHPFIASAMKERAISIEGSDGRKLLCYNHNKLLWRLSDPRVLGKTGYTRSAGHCYAGVAYGKKRHTAFVILKSRKPWLDIYRILDVRPKKRSRG